jgi:SAM-dependent methyltransferase
MHDDYRTRIYRNYATRFQDSGGVFDAAAADRWGRAYDHYLRGWLPKHRKARILDLACGGGELLYFLKARGYLNICGVDISPEQVKLSRQVIQEVHLGDALEFLEARPLTFDLIIGLDILEHLHKKEVLRFLDLSFGSLCSKGRLLLQVPNTASAWGAGLMNNDFTHESHFSPNTLSRLIQLSGFIHCETREQGPIPWGYSLISSMRYFGWRCARTAWQFFNFIETGGFGQGVYTRSFIIKGEK